MEAREILIANTKTQTRSKVTTDATTLGELKAALTEANINYAGLTFTEGISKTQLLDDDTQLPQNVMYKGSPTNNLVILLTNTKKNIASGANTDRAYAYSLIKSNDLQEKVKETFGKNFTQVSTAELLHFIDANNECTETDCTEEENEEDNYNDYEEDYNEDCQSNSTSPSVLDSFYNSIITLMDTNQLSIDEVQDFQDKLLVLVTVRKTPNPINTSDGSITNEDIDNMLNELGM